MTSKQTNSQTPAPTTNPAHSKSSAVITVDKGKQRIYLQDLGRQGANQVGVTCSGAADEYAFLQANLALSNQVNALALEILFGNIELTILQHCLLVVTGADVQLTLNDTSIPSWQTFEAQAGDHLSIAPMKNGNYAYLAIKGGFDAPIWFSSAIQQPKTPNAIQFYQAPEQLSSQTPATRTSTTQISAIEENAQPVRNRVNYQDFYFNANQPATLRFIANRTWQTLSAEQQTCLCQQTFTLDASSNKMGYRFNLLTNQPDAIPLHSDLEASLSQQISDASGTISKPVTYGQIQLPNSNQWIVLMKDRQTIGGYPSIGSVMKTDLFRLAQLKPHQSNRLQPIRFQPITLAQAQAQLAAFYQRFAL